jgi:hypothetical protein
MSSLEQSKKPLVHEPHEKHEQGKKADPVHSCGAVADFIFVIFRVFRGLK